MQDQALTISDTSILRTHSANNLVGRIVSVSGSQAIVLIKAQGIDQTQEEALDTSVAMGSFVKVVTPTTIIIGLVSGASVPVPAQNSLDAELRIAEIELLGELYVNEHGENEFRRGVSVYPTLEDRVYATDKTDLGEIFDLQDNETIKIGVIHQDKTIPAKVDVTDLIAKHFAVVGTTGTGKSCAVALILRAVLNQSPDTHLVLLDPHNEYSSSFGDQAEYISPTNLNLPYWLLTFEELSEVIVGPDKDKRRAETEVLRELVRQAKVVYSKNPTSRAAKSNSLLLKEQQTGNEPQISVDTPTPFRVSDVVSMLDQEMGRLEKSESTILYKRLKARFEALTTDTRYGFMFGGLTVTDSMSEVISRIFRIPMLGRPISIIDLSGVPSEIVNVVVSVIARMAFDLALWSEKSVPITLVCEEAHLYVPQDHSKGFEPTKRAIERIAKEGRKYGVSLCVISQRPSELDATIMSQCNTVFALRLTNEIDQQFVRTACSDSAMSMLEFLPTMGNAEAIAFGEGVPFPMRIILDRLPEDAIPATRDARSRQTVHVDMSKPDFLENVIERWRAQHRSQKDIVAEHVRQSAQPDNAQLQAPVQEPSAVQQQPARPSIRKQPVQAQAAAEPQPARQQPAAQQNPAPQRLTTKLTFRKQ